MFTRPNFLLLALLIGLAGCQRVDSQNPNQNVVALADTQRFQVTGQTRAASYSVYPDTDDAEKLKDPTFLDAMHAESANGSAFAVRADGLVITNVHVIEGTNYCTGNSNTKPTSEEDFAKEKGRHAEETARREGKKETHCLFVTQAFSKVYRAKLIKLDQVNDVAVMCLKNVDGKLPFLKLAMPGTYHDGAEVLTIGAPLGNTNMLTLGYISNLDFFPQDKETGRKEARKIQFSAPILPGNSGGPLVSVASGEIVGQVVAIIMYRGIPTQMSYANPVEFLRENTNNIPPCDKIDEVVQGDSTWSEIWSKMVSFLRPSQNK